jgi:hypothetical protein
MLQDHGRTSLIMLWMARCLAAEYANAPFPHPSLPLFFVVAIEDSATSLDNTKGA